jgi:hypothetical protein
MVRRTDDSKDGWRPAFVPHGPLVSRWSIPGQVGRTSAVVGGTVGCCRRNNGQPDVHELDVQLVPFGSSHAVGPVVGETISSAPRCFSVGESHREQRVVDDQDPDGGSLPPSSKGSRMTKALSSTMRLQPPPTKRTA